MEHDECPGWQPAASAHLLWRLFEEFIRRAAGKRESCAVLMSPPVTPSAWASSTEMVKVDQDPVGPHGVSGRESVLVDLSHAAWCG